MSMLPRVLVPFQTLCTSEPTMEQLVHELQTELRQTQNRLSEESRKRAEAEAHVSILKRNRVKQPVIPRGDCEEGYECSNCGRSITDDFTYCPDCGHEIDWNGWDLPEPKRHEPLDLRVVHHLAANGGRW